MEEVSINQLKLAHLEVHRFHERGELIDSSTGGTVAKSGPHRLPIRIPEQIIGAFEKLLAFESEFHDPVTLL